jgi:putative ABC transport system permease protein
MLRATLRSLLARKLRLLLSGIAVVLGVTFVAGAFILTDTIGQVFDQIFANVNAKIAVVVRGNETAVSSTRQPVPESVLAAVRSLPGVKSAEGAVGGYAQLVDKKGKTYPYHSGPPALGFSYSGDDAISSIDIVAGQAPSTSNQIAIDKATAQATHFHVGDTVKVLTRLAPKRYRVTGIFISGGSTNQGGASITLFTQLRAQQIFGRPGQFDEIDVAATPGVTEQQLRDRIAKVLPSGVQAVTGTKAAADNANDVKSGLKFFTTFLLVFAGVALFVGAFIIFNTFTMLVAQRLRELALMRALGASRGQIIRSVVTEAIVVGTVASTVGLLFGYGVAYGMRALLESFGGGDFGTGTLVIAARTVIASYAVGILITAAAALVPAWRAARIPPVAALRDAALPETSMRRSLLVGSLLLVGGVAALVPGLGGNAPLLAVGAVAIFLGVAGLSPLAVPTVVRFVSMPFRRRVPGQLGRRNAMRNPRRTSTTAGALMIGLALVSAVSVLGASIKTSVKSIINQAFAGDFVVEPKGFDNEISPALAKSLEGKPEIAQVDSLGFSPALISGHKVAQVTALPPSAVGVTVAVKPIAGVMQVDPRSILIDKTTATKYHWHVGSTLAVRYERGPTHPLTVAGIYSDNQLAGSYLVDQTERRWFEDRLDGVVLIKDAPGTSTKQVRATLTDATKAYPNVNIRDHDEFIKEVVGNINGLLTVVTVLLVLSVIIAVLGIVNTLALSVIERTRELGLLRAVGLSRRQLRRMIRVESVVVSVFGGLLGLVVGTGLGIAMTNALHSQGFDALTIPVVSLIEFVVLAGIAGVIAAIWPARRAAKLDVLTAIAAE